MIACLWLALPVPALAQTEDEERDRSYLAGLIEDNLSSVSREVRIDGFRGALSSQATIRRLTIADAEGIWLEAEGLVLDWQRSALLSGRLEVQALTAERITLHRAPLSEAAPPSPEAVAFALPDLPVAVTIGALTAREIVLAAPVLGQEVRLSLTGSAQLAGGAGVARIEALRLDGAEGRFLVTGSYSNTTRVLSVQADLAEAAGGLVARTLGLPGAPALALQVAGIGPIDDYHATLRLATDGQNRVSGNLRLLTVPGEGALPARQVTLAVRGDVTPLLAPEYHAFFGSDARLALTGQRGGDGVLDLQALDIATRSVRLTGAARIGPDGWPQALRLTGDLGAPSGGPLILPVPGGQTTVTAADLDISYDARQGDGWTGRFVARDFARPGLRLPDLALEGSGTIRPRSAGAEGAFTADLVFAADGIALDDAALATAIGPQVTGRVALSRAGGGALELTGLSVDGPGLTAQGQASVTWPEGGVPLVAGGLTLTAADLRRFAPLSGLALAGRASLLTVFGIEPLTGAGDLIVTGQTQDLALGIARLDPLLAGAGELSVGLVRDGTGTRLQDLRVTSPALTVTGGAVLTSRGFAADLDLALADVGRAVPGLTGAARFAGQVQQDAAGRLTLAGDLSLPGAMAQVTGQAEAGAALAVEGQVQVPDLAAYAVMAGLPGLRGAADLAVAGVVPGLAGLDLTVSGQTRDLALGLGRLDALTAGAGRLEARLTGQASGLSLPALRLSTEALEVTGALTLGTDIAADLDLRLDDAARLDGRLAGPVTARGRVTLAGGTIRPDLSGTALGGRWALTGSLPPGQDFAGQMQVALPDLSVLARLTGRPVDGAADLTATGTVARDLQGAELAVTGSVQGLSLRVAALDPVLTGAGDLAARLTWAAPVLSLRDMALRLPGLTATGTLAQGPVGLTGDIDLTVPDLAPLDARLAGPARLTGPLAVLPDGAVTTPGLTLRALGGVAELSGVLAPQATGFDGTLTADLPDLAPLSDLAGTPLSGGMTARLAGRLTPDLGDFDLTLTASLRDLRAGNAALATLLRGQGTLEGRFARAPGGGVQATGLRASFPNLTARGEVTGARGAGTARFEARLADIALFAPDFSGPATATGTATRTAGGDWLVDTRAGGPGGTSAIITGRLGAAGQLALAVVGQAPLGLINPLIEPRRLSGMADLDLRLDGAPRVESLTGTVTLRDARLSAPTLGQALSDITGTARLAGGRAALDLRAQVQAGGQLDVSGDVALGAPHVADLAVAVRGLVLRDPALYDTTADGQVTIQGPLAGGARIAGSIALGRTEVQVPSSGVGALGDLPDVIHIGPPPDVRETLTRAGLTGDGAGGGGATTAGAAYPLDLTITAPARVFVRGRGLDAELGGSLRLTGTTANVVPAGEFSLIRGRIEILQQRFDLTEGSASLQGGFVPVLRLVARTRARTGTEIDITLQGPATAPQVIFTARPDLPQDEVLAQLLFGRDLSTITPLQAVQLAAAVGTLAGRGGGGIIAGLRDSIGVDDFDVTADAEGNAALRVGKYLDDTLYTDVTIGTQQSEITLNLDLTDDITARGSVSTTGETALGIYFERDY